jgi:hypothetical protein
VSKDRAAPFSKKHRRYWIPVTGGMVLIGAINVGLGLITYERAGDPEPMHVQLPYDAGFYHPGSLSVAQIPTAVMQAFALKYPRTVPAGGDVDVATGNIIVLFAKGAAKARATFRGDGTFVADE